jgi:hypothetical protein
MSSEILLRRSIQRLLYEEIIRGRKLDKYSTVLRRHVINAIKDEEIRSHFSQTGKAQFKLQDVPELDDIEYLRDVIVNLEDSGNPNRVAAHASYEFDLDASPKQRTTSDLIVTIRVDKNFEDRVLGIVHEELSDSVRHELEHSSQDTEELMDCQRQVPDANIWDTLGKARSYYLCPAEKKAHIVGFMKRAKQKKKMVVDVLDNELLAIYQMGLDNGHDEKEIDLLMADIRSEYREYLKTRYPKAEMN